MKPKEKIRFVAKQIDNMVAHPHKRMVIHCPFCGLDTTPREGVLCCDNLAEVVNALVDHVEHKERMEILERIRERMDAMDRAPMVVLQ